MTAFSTKMNFEIIEDSINTILTAHAVDNNYSLLKYSPISISAELVKLKKQVWCNFDNSSLPSVNNTLGDDKIQHELTYRVSLFVAVDSSDEDSGFLDASLKANTEMNAFIRQIWQVLMQGESLYLGTDDESNRYGIISERKIGAIQKTTIDKDSGHSIIRADMNLSCQTAESPFTITGLPIDSADADLTLGADPNDGNNLDSGLSGVTSPTP